MVLFFNVFVSESWDNMKWIRIFLLLLSILQYIFIDSFWESAYVVFFIWIIFFQLLWFYIEKPQLKKWGLVFAGFLALLNSQLLPHLPFLMLSLYVLEIRLHFNLKQTSLILGSLLIAMVGLFVYQGAFPAVTEWLALFGLSTISFWSAEQQIELEYRQQEYYEHLLTQSDLETKSDLLKGQMQAMEELSIINERNRISRDLHDSVGHTLSTIVIQLAAISKLTEESNPAASKMLQQLHQFAKDGLTNIRQVIHEMKPANYRKIAFVERIKALIQEFELNSQIQVFFQANDMLWALNEEQETLIFRAIQEFLGNSAKHSQADEIRIQYHFTQNTLILTMQDNGIGTAAISPKMGLTGMEERVKLLGGKLTMQSAVGQGFRSRIVLPKGGFIHENDPD